MAKNGSALGCHTPGGYAVDWPVKNAKIFFALLQNCSLIRFVPSGSDPVPKARVGMGFPEAKWLFSRVAKVIFLGCKWVQMGRKIFFAGLAAKKMPGEMDFFFFFNFTIWPKF